MNDELANALNAHMNEDTGLLDMPAVITTLETYCACDLLEAYYTGGSEKQDEAREAYQTAIEWNRAIMADIAPDNQPGSWRGVRAFMVALAWVLAPLAAVAAIGF